MLAAAFSTVVASATAVMLFSRLCSTVLSVVLVVKVRELAARIDVLAAMSSTVVASAIAVALLNK